MFACTREGGGRSLTDFCRLFLGTPCRLLKKNSAAGVVRSVNRFAHVSYRQCLKATLNFVQQIFIEPYLRRKIINAYAK